jgi:hypothetical protein
MPTGTPVFTPSEGSSHRQDKTVPGLCPRIVEEESDETQGRGKDRKAGKVSKELSRNGGNERDMTKKGKERRKSSV